MKPPTPALLAAALLAGCSGTKASFDGTVCGQQVTFELVDRTDREGSVITVDCGEGKGSITLDLSGKATSTVTAADVEMVRALDEAFQAGVAAARPGP